MELRKDYILDNWVILSDKRKDRPFMFDKKKADEKKDCVFCAGNENQTPKEVYKVEKKGKWSIRVIPNKFSSVDPNGNPNIETHNRFYTFAGDHGEHEVIIETPKHAKDFSDLDVSDIIDIMRTYNSRINSLLAEESIRYVCLFKNKGADGGASIDHAHSQIIAVSMLPPTLSKKLEAIKKYPSCPHCDIIKSEKDSYRRAFENDTFVAFCPYASLYNYELWIFPKEHKKTLNDFSEKDLYDLANIYRQALKKLEEKDIDYDVDWYYSPKDENMHFHIEIKPRIQKWAGFEIGYGIIVNEVSPENAAKFYRGEL